MVKKISGEKILGGGVPYLVIFPRFLYFKNFYKCLTSHKGKKTLFFKKCPNNGLVSEKNTLYFSLQFFFEGFPKVSAVIII